MLFCSGSPEALTILRGSGHPAWHRSSQFSHGRQKVWRRPVWPSCLALRAIMHGFGPLCCPLAFWGLQHRTFLPYLTRLQAVKPYKEELPKLICQLLAPKGTSVWCNNFFLPTLLHEVIYLPLHHFFILKVLLLFQQL